MKALGVCLRTVSDIIAILICGSLHLVKCVWLFISWAYYAAINFIGENKAALVVTTVSLALVFIYLIAKILEY